MLLAIVVTAAPEQSQGAWSAYRFTCAALSAGHQIYRIFFYHEGIWNGAMSKRPPQDEASLPQLWRELASQH